MHNFTHELQVGETSDDISDDVAGLVLVDAELWLTRPSVPGSWVQSDVPLSDETTQIADIAILHKDVIVVHGRERLVKLHDVRVPLGKLSHHVYFLSDCDSPLSVVRV